ncbi:hypothetical protein [Spelaeicoccus albus]|uniref:DUF4386 family protein n=1 Tax=Spelaeicoccus albus TaxID=1280376 RepID=A0A7Z0ABA3_9MICO|nr:hypothetical protein [Spelaeicoccus albus]NYI67038.1 hypothetical protein [Spelaeicoccus albus]
MTNIASGARTRHRPDGPPAGVLATVVLALTVASAIAYILDSAFWNGVFVFASATPLGIYAATVYARLLRLGIRVPGPGISFFGGISASVLLALTGLLGFAVTRVTGMPEPLTDFVTELDFLLGGVGFATAVGLLIAGIAVPSVILRLVPRGLGWTGLVLGALGEISILAMLWSGFEVLLPIVRFLGLAWLAVVGFLLPHNRHELGTRRG